MAGAGRSHGWKKVEELSFGGRTDGAGRLSQRLCKTAGDTLSPEMEDIEEYTGRSLAKVEVSSNILVSNTNYQSQLSARIPANSSRYFLSTSSNPAVSVQSISMMATVYSH